MDTNNSKNNFSHPAVIVTTLILIFIGGYFFLNKKTPEVQENIPNPQQEQIDNLKKELDALKQKESTNAKSLESTKKSIPNLSSIISEWKSRTVFISCSGNDINTGQPYTQTGTGAVVKTKSGFVRILTNKHVILNENGYFFNQCSVSFQDSGKTFFISSDKMVVHPNSSIDAAQIGLDETDPYIASLVNKKILENRTCSKPELSKPTTGDQVVLIGYPGIGSQTDITATDGIISGYDYPYFVTSAKIDHGNSGGIAILIKNDCYLGIPTGSVVGEIESLGRILDVGVIIATQ